MTVTPKGAVKRTVELRNRSLILEYVSANREGLARNISEANVRRLR